MARKGEYKYALNVNGAEVARGDHKTIEVIFGNMQGRNFVGEGAITHETHQEWLAWASAHFDTALVPGMAIEVRSPAGALLMEDVITLRVQTEPQANCC